MTSIPAPSPRTKPSLFISNGLLAFSGISLACERALIFANPAIVKAVTLASVPPVTIASASPANINLIAIPIASVAEAQAEVTVWFGPLSPHLIDKCPPAIFAIILGTNCGDTLLAPL